MNDKHIDCMCKSEGLRISSFDDELYISVYVSRSTEALTLWQRIKFVFNRWNVYSEIMLEKNSVQELVDYCNEWLATHKNNAS